MLQNSHSRYYNLSVYSSNPPTYRCSKGKGEKKGPPWLIPGSESKYIASSWRRASYKREERKKVLSYYKVAWENCARVSVFPLFDRGLSFMVLNPISLLLKHVNWIFLFLWIKILKIFYLFFSKSWHICTDLYSENMN